MAGPINKYSAQKNRVIVYFLVFLCWSNYCEGKIQQNLQQIPLKDQKQIEQFFRELIVNHSFGYTLFGCKPMSIECWPEECDIGYTLCGIDHTSALESGWEVWKKYRHLFPSEKYIFSDHLITTPEGATFHEIYLINVVECQRVYAAYPTLFQEGIPPVKFLQSEARSHLQLGLLLGFGYHNASCFQNRKDILLMMLRKNDHNGDQHWGRFQRYRKDSSLAYVALPAFMVDYQAEETKQLYQQYTACRKKIISILNDSNFLEVVLETLCE